MFDRKALRAMTLRQTGVQSDTLSPILTTPMQLSSIRTSGKRGGIPVRWQDDKVLRYRYLRIYREVVIDKIPARLVAASSGVSRQHVYWIVSEVEKSGILKGEEDRGRS
jgi:hypothetical protein